MAGMEIETFDAIVIGAGQGGKPLALDLANAGRSTALVERKYVGGTCINVGCTPTKTMVASARVAHLARRSADYGVHAGPVAVDMSEVRARKQAIVDSFRTSSERRIEATRNLELVRGDARFVDRKTLEVAMNDGSTRRMTAEWIFVDTGGRPSPLDVPGAGDVEYLDSTSIMELDRVPEHLVVVGGSYIGLEFSQMFRRFGSRVTVVQRSARLLSREDPDVADAVAEILREDGVELVFNAKPAGVAPSGDGVALAVRTPDGERTIEGSHLLVAIGRTPNTDTLGLEAAGIRANARGQIEVDDRLETSVPGVYAIGDVKGGPEFTHISYDDYRILRDNLLGGGNATIANRLVPYTVFIDPQLGRIGLSETEARERGLDVRVAKIPMDYVARAIEMSETRGFMKAVVDPATGQILGAAVLGIEGGELMAMFEIAIMGRVPYTVLKEAVFAHPTLAESLNTLFTSLEE